MDRKQPRIFNIVERIWINPTQALIAAFFLLVFDCLKTGSYYTFITGSYLLLCVLFTGTFYSNGLRGSIYI